MYEILKELIIDAGDPMISLHFLKTKKYLDMSDFQELAGNFAERLKDILTRGARVSSEDIPGLLEGRGGTMNCYPGGQPGQCCDNVAVVSLMAPSIKRNMKGHLWFEGALDALYNHVFHVCPGKTKAAVLIVDSWDPSVWEKWRDKMTLMQKVVHFEMYLIADYNVYEIHA
jgi:hypothetical protein